MTRHRLDEALAARGDFPSRARARDAIVRGTVFLNGSICTKPAQGVSEKDSITIDDPAQRYVSRAALKLVHGLDHFGVDAKDRVCLDIGASTGGFTQVLLERGARHVRAIDVGHGQMDAQISDDPRVELVEGLNARDISSVPGGLSLIVCDVSFIPLKLALPAALDLAPKGCLLLALIKPQFEVGRENIGKGGVVRDADLQIAACDDICVFLQNRGWLAEKPTPSPLIGGDGNQEFIVFARKSVTGK